MGAGSQKTQETFNKKSHRLNPRLPLVTCTLNRREENIKEDTVVKNIHLYIFFL